ncbi:hypothetical protein ACRAWD_00775 [Caulobacter segnis]
MSNVEIAVEKRLRRAAGLLDAGRDRHRPLPSAPAQDGQWGAELLALDQVTGFPQLRQPLASRTSASTRTVTQTF